MRTVIETPTFQKQADKLWSENERLSFIDWIAANPLVGVSFLAQKGRARCVGAEPAWVSVVVCAWCISA